MAEQQEPDPYQKRIDELRGDPSRDPFVDAEDVGEEMAALMGARPRTSAAQKALFLLWPQRSGTVECLYFKVPGWKEASRAPVRAFAILEGVPSYIIAPSGWSVLAVVAVQNGERWAMVFSEMERPKAEPKLKLVP